MKILQKTIPFFLVMAALVSCRFFTPGSTPEPISSEPGPSKEILVPAISDSPFPPSQKITYYYFVDVASEVPPEGSVVIMPEVYILAPTFTDLEYGPDPAADLRDALEAALSDERNGWTSSGLQIVEASFDDAHANVILQGEYFGVGDVTLIAARMQILMTVFANRAVMTASISLNGDTIGNLGVSNSMNARPADYIFTRAEVEAYMNENAYTSP